MYVVAEFSCFMCVCAMYLFVTLIETLEPMKVKSLPEMHGNFCGYKFSRNKPKFGFQKIFPVLIFAIGESGTCGLAISTAKS